MYPLPKNKQFLLQSQNIAVIVQLLLVENNDLTRCILVFILRHLDSHYALFQLRQSGVVEFLMLQLDNQTPTKTEYDMMERIPLQSKDQDLAAPSSRQVNLPDTLAECALQLLIKF